jgi:putative Mg2+ transporter-C (MgtC) family protein
MTESDMIMRLLIGMGLGALVGFERELSGQFAGLRTYTILVIGSTLAMTISINMAIQFQPMAPNGDPARLAAQVVSGIGFLGAGAILRFGSHVKGLTTATSLWTMAMVGLAVGAGYLVPALAATGLLLVVLVLLDILEDRVIHSFEDTPIAIRAIDRQDLIEELRQTIRSSGGKVSRVSLDKHIENGEIYCDFHARFRESHKAEHLVKKLEKVQGLISFKIG